MSIRVALVDDDPLVRNFIASILDPHEDLEVVGQAGDGDEVLGLIHDTKPHVVLLDLNMPRMSGVEVLKQLNGLPNRPAVIALTTWDFNDSVVQACKEGANGYLLKTESPSAIAHAIRQAAEGGSPMSADAMRRIVQAIANDPGQEQRRRAQQLLDQLTPRELEVAKAVATGASNEDIGKLLHLSAGSVKQHLSTINTKLGVNGRVLLAALATEAGHGPSW